MPDTLTTFSPPQKERYVGVVNEVLNSKQQVFGWLDKVSADGGGLINANPGTTATRGLHFLAHLGRNATGTYQDPEVGFPSSGQQRYKQGYLQGRTIYWPMAVSRASIARTRTDDAAYARVMVEAAVRTGNDLRNEIERTTLGDGSGTLCVIASAAAVSANTITITIDNYQDLRKLGIGQYVQVWTSRLYNVAQISWVSAGTPASQFIGQITALNTLSATPTFTIAPVSPNTVFTTTNAAIVAGMIVTKASDATIGAVTPVQNQGPRTLTQRFEPIGLDGMVSDCDSPMESGLTAGGYEGINAPAAFGVANSGSSGAGGAAQAGEPAWASYVNRSTNPRAFNDAILQSMLDRPMIDYGERPTFITASYGARWELANSKLAIRRSVNTMEISGSTGAGFTESEDGKDFITYDGIPVVPSRYAPTNFLSPSLTASYIALNLSEVKVYEWHPISFMDDDGLTWRMLARSPVFEAFLEYTYEIMTAKRNAHAKAVSVLATDFT